MLPEQGLLGTESRRCLGMPWELTLTVRIHDLMQRKLNLRCRIDTLDEVEYFKNGGILQFVLRDLAKAA